MEKLPDNNTEASPAQDWESLSQLEEPEPVSPEPDHSDDEKQKIIASRAKRVEWIKGTYTPTVEDFWLFDADDDFYSSSEYLAYRKTEYAIIANAHKEVFSPSDEKVSSNISPLYEKVLERIDSLDESIRNFDIQNPEEGIKNTSSLFASLLGLKQAPNITFDGESNLYLSETNTVNVVPDKKRSIPELIGTIAHEHWHAYQEQESKTDSENGKLYALNSSEYFSSSVDYDMYFNQILEKEAFYFGDKIIELCRQRFLAVHPEKIPEMKRKYTEWLDEKYSPEKTEDGLDYQMLCDAAHHHPMLKRIKTIFARRRKS